MATSKPGSIEQDLVVQEKNLSEFAHSLLAMENLDRESPELWPEKIPGVADFVNSFNDSSKTCNSNGTNTNNKIKLPYSKDLTTDDQNYIHVLAALPATALIAKVKELHDITYQLGVEEAKEVTRSQYLDLFKRRNKVKK